MFKIKCTIFSTHNSSIISKANKNLFEIALHPNFNDLFNGNLNNSFDNILDEIMDIHPYAKGIRTHTLMQSIPILQKFADKGFIYESNNFLPYHTDLKPFKLWNGLVRIPYNWEDDVHWNYGYSFDDARVSLDSNSLTVFDFHPIHVFINTENKYRYNEAKKHYKDPQKLLELRNKEVPGTRDLFINLLKHCKQNSIKTYTLIDIAEDFLKNNK
ncbi:MAG: hypothetical protein L0Y77_00805 [Chlorobi bacterium]|nr:hypothetical protein [Chlorobiota bacterium]